jgi:hypothetical protein
MSKIESSKQTTEVRFSLNKEVNENLKKVQAAIVVKKSERRVMDDLYNEAMTLGTQQLMQQLEIKVA